MFYQKLGTKIKKSTPAEERLRIVEAAAAIIREDIRSSVVETKTYPPPNKMLDDINEEIPKTLSHFLEEIILKNRKGEVDHLKTKCTSISHAIMSSIRERSFSSQLLLGLSVFLHRRYGSKKLLDVLSNLGFAASYSNTLQYEVSAVYHPQPRILSSESGAFVQYVGDNADINVSTLDGNNTLHVMGMIKIVTPKDAVIYDDRIKKCTTKPSAKELATISHISLLAYEKPVVPGYSKIQVQNVHDDQVLIEKNIDAVDFLWLYGKWKNFSPLPGWNGYLEQLTENNKNFSTSQVIFLPFIDHPASNLDTIYTTLHCAINIAKSHQQKACIITFDQPLYSKAREMVAASDTNSDLSKTVVKLGGFHMLMSFLGCIGYVMDGSGLKEALSTIYATNSVDKMLNGHAYARSMIKLEETMDEQTFENFKNGFFTVKRTEKFNSGTWPDMVIEQSLMKSMKTEGGVSRGRSTQKSVLCKWVYGMYATNTICEEIERFCKISFDSVDQHVDARDSRIKRDNTDVNELVDWFTLHNPFPNTNQLVSLASGIVGNDQINCHRALEIGLQSMVKITGLNFNEIKLKRVDKVLPLSAVNKSVKINDCKVSVDPLLLFQRITVSKKFESNLQEYLQYELSPYPTSLFDSNGMRKTTKATLYDNMVPVDIDLDENNVTYVVDGGFLLHRVVWSKDDTFSIILDKYIKYLQTHYGSKIVVVFDGYSDYSKNIKAMEQQRRTAALSKSYEVCFDETMIVPISQAKFLSNKSNKKKL
ncbi:unnamed protein product [Diatraea saccharalis]|uniref:Uncharacterized protein n=1 Tax=Diatraea saccharalis TaxID=40085 RepID=A0A9N9MZP4_9NEOP|nr:unnamed protein product [Diatraea saccharalis]